MSVCGAQTCISHEVKTATELESNSQRRENISEARIRLQLLITVCRKPPREHRLSNHVRAPLRRGRSVCGRGAHGTPWERSASGTSRITLFENTNSESDLCRSEQPNNRRIKWGCYTFPHVCDASIMELMGIRETLFTYWCVFYADPNWCWILVWNMQLYGLNLSVIYWYFTSLARFVL